MPNEYEKFYKILDLDVGASKEEVKKSFRELSHIWHPDNHLGKPPNIQNRAIDKFREISNAYQVLDKKFRKEDSFHEAEQKRGGDQNTREREDEEHKYWEEQAKNKHEEEKSKQKNKGNSPENTEDSIYNADDPRMTFPEVIKAIVYFFLIPFMGIVGSCAILISNQ